MDTFPKVFCHRLRDARRARGMTQAELARQVGCQQSAISMMESGCLTALARETLERIAGELGVPFEEPSASAAVPGVEGDGQAHCPEPECPSNVPFVVNGALVLWPTVQPVPGGRHCACCGELLVRRCRQCGAPAVAGACCRRCGSAYVPAPAASDVVGWAEGRRQQIAAWRALI